MELKDFRDGLINEIKATGIEEATHPADVYLREIKETLVHDFTYVPDLIECFVEQERGGSVKRKFKIDAGFFEIASNTLHLLIVDFDDDISLKTITNEDIKKNSDYMLSYVENFVLNRNANILNLEDSQPHVQLATEIRQNLRDLYTIQLYYASTNILSKSVKNTRLDDLNVEGFTFKVKLEVIDIQKFFNSKASEFKKEAIEIHTSDYGLEGIQAVKAMVESEEYEAYLAVVPGEFLSEIYKDYGSRLLEANVRSFLNASGAINKGIAKTIINDQSKFFAYNNGISTTAKSVEFKFNDQGMMLTKFVDFQIINGGQTTASLASSSIREKIKLSNIYVQMKLTILKKENPDLIRSIARYANSQNKVTAADLSSNIEYFVKMEELSRKIYTVLPGLPYQTRWFFERTRGQYKQSMMKMSNAEISNFERSNPKNQKFGKTDLAKYSNAYDIKPFDVAWGSEINASRFVNEVDLMWDDNPNQFNELYYKKTIAKAILFKSVEKIISNQDWYMNNKGYRAEMVGYVVSKLVHDLKNKELKIDLMEIWKFQSISDVLSEQIALISGVVFEHFYDKDRPISNIREYAKREICWTKLQNKFINYNSEFLQTLIGLNENKEEENHAQKNQAFENELLAEIEVFNLGKDYWSNILAVGIKNKIVSEKDISLINATIKYCSGSQAKYTNLMAKYVIKLRNRFLEKDLIIN